MGKLDALRRALVRYLDRPATQGAQEKTPPSVRAFEARFEDGKMILPDDLPPEVRAMMEKIAAERVPDLANSGDAPPRRPDADPIIGTPWSDYREAATHFVRPGWAFGRFGYRIMPMDTCGALFGWLNGDFGVARQPYHCCGTGDAQGDERILSSLIYLPAGAFVGVFVTEHMAAEAGEIMSRMSDDFSKIDWLAAPDHLLVRVTEAWKAAGLYPAHFHAHPRGCSEAVPVWFKNHHSTVLGKPASFGDLS